jgi:phenylacetate-CoA ligase
LEKTQYLAPSILEDLQFESLRRLLVHCYLQVPFYRRRFDEAGFDPLRFSDPADFKRIPYLTKTDLQRHAADLVANNYRLSELVPDASGGSTGKPTNFYKDRLRNQLRSADKMRHDRWCGWREGEKYVTLWGAQREFDPQIPLKTRLVERYVYRAFGFNAFDITPEKVVAYLAELKKVRPAMIVAYANVAHLFARIVSQQGIDLSNLGVKGIISSAETLTPEKRADIEAAFRTKVLNRYGSREVGVVASECLHQEGLHVNAENVLVEIQRAGKDTAAGEPGEIIVTDLWNYGMPFIRYQMGDVGVKSDRHCSCGRGLPLLQQVSGRVSDFIVDSGGGLVHGEYFTHLFYGLHGVEQFQLVQEDRTRIVLNVHPGDGFQQAVLDPVIAKIKTCLGTAVEVEVRLVGGSLIEASGKYRFTISKVSCDRFAGLGDPAAPEKP